MRASKEKELHAIIELCKPVSNIKIANSDSPFLTIENHLVTFSDGFTMMREKIIKNGSDGHASAILPITENNEIVFVVQPRPSVKEQVALEIPAGYWNIGENGLTGGLRELEEETGLICALENVTKITDYYQDTGISGANIHVYLATNCVDTFKQHLDKDERVKLFRCSIEEGLELFESNRLHGASSKLAFAMGKPLIKERTRK